MFSFALRQDVYYAIANHKVTLLDLRADRYLCLPPDADRAFQRLVTAGEIDSVDARALTSLKRAGLLVESSEAFKDVKRERAVPTHCLLDTARPQAKLTDMVDALASQTVTALELRTRPLHRILSDVQRFKSVAHAQGMPPEGVLWAFLASRRLIGTHDHCLRWSLALVRYLARRRYFPQLVIGVKMAPFQAHAWVQYEDMVLNDEVDLVLSYTPILVI